jgi:hypothetical protein
MWSERELDSASERKDPGFSTENTTNAGNSGSARARKLKTAIKSVHPARIHAHWDFRVTSFLPTGVPQNAIEDAMNGLAWQQRFSEWKTGRLLYEG